MSAYIHDSFLVKLTEPRISKIITETLEQLLPKLYEILRNEDKYTFSKDTIPFYPSILSLGAYDGHLVGESASSKHDIVKQFTDIQKAHKRPVNKMVDMATDFTHKLKIGDSVHISKIISETDEELILKNVGHEIAHRMRFAAPNLVNFLIW